MQSIRRSVALMRASLGVLRSDKELLLFPIMAALALLVLAAIFVLPFVGLAAAAPPGEPVKITPAVLIGVVAAYYIVAHIVAYFFNTALVGAALIRLDGGNPTVGAGLRIAAKRLPAIIVYALVAATIGYVLRSSNRRGFLGLAILGLAFTWSVATFLVVPIIAAEGLSAWGAIRKSVGLVRDTWGEQLVGGLGFGLLFAGLVIVAVFGGGFVYSALAPISAALAVAAIIAGGAVLGAVGLIAFSANAIFTASVYRFAMKGDAGFGFSTEALRGTFRVPGGLSIEPY
jgi:hypothetical protein